MAKWKYDISTDGKKLRELIYQGSSKENCDKILQQIIICCKHAEAQLTLDDRDDYECDIDELATDCDDTKYYLDEFDEELNEENIDDMLERFYDLMDSMRVWVGL